MGSFRRLLRAAVLLMVLSISPTPNLSLADPRRQHSPFSIEQEPREIKPTNFLFVLSDICCCRLDTKQSEMPEFKNNPKKELL